MRQPWELELTSGHLHLELGIEILPFRIALLDQSDLPGSVPFLELLFAANGV
jgi:hypothetical protein